MKQESNKKRMVYKKNGKKHRKDGFPAQVTKDQIRFYENGELHRVDGPAIICTNGDRLWYFRGEFTDMIPGCQNPNCGHVQMTAWEMYQKLFPDDDDM